LCGDAFNRHPRRRSSSTSHYPHPPTVEKFHESIYTRRAIEAAFAT
jgi:hypothetical protein